MWNNFEKFSFPSIEKRWTKDKETDGQKRKKEKKKKRTKEQNKTKQNGQYLFIGAKSMPYHRSKKALFLPYLSFVFPPPHKMFPFKVCPHLASGRSSKSQITPPLGLKASTFFKAPIPPLMTIAVVIVFEQLLGRTTLESSGTS